MRASFDDNGNLILHPESNLERMACGHFVSALHRRNRPQVVVEGQPAVSVAAKDIPGQQSLEGTV